MDKSYFNCFTSAHGRRSCLTSLTLELTLVANHFFLVLHLQFLAYVVVLQLQTIKLLYFFGLDFIKSSLVL